MADLESRPATQRCQRGPTSARPGARSIRDQARPPMDLVPVGTRVTNRVHA